MKTVLREGSLQEKMGPSVATELSALLPTANADPGVGAGWTVIVSQRWPDLTDHFAKTTWVAWLVETCSAHL